MDYDYDYDHADDFNDATDDEEMRGISQEKVTDAKFSADGF